MKTDGLDVKLTLRGGLRMERRLARVNRVVEKLAGNLERAADALERLQDMRGE
jgi:hypothetical protein